MNNSIKNKIIAAVAVVAIATGGYALGATGSAIPHSVSAAPVLYSADTVTSIYDKAGPAVVEIDVTEAGSGYFNRAMQGQGSGFLFDNQGHILTNNHVVDGATSVKVILDNGSSIDAKVVGTDSLHDLAVISVDASAMKGVTPLQLADSKLVKPGQMAIAMGTPYGLTDTVTVGIISGLNRTVSGSTLTGMLQTDAAINPGNSGGPLLDVNGQVIGINTAIEVQVTGANGLGFAVPSSVVQAALPNLLAGKEVVRPYLGISGTALTQTLAASLNLSVNQGVYIASVVSGSPADKAGLIAGAAGTAGAPGAGGDVIMAVDGTSVKSVQELSACFNTKNVGDTVTLSVLRGGSSLSVKVTLGAWPGSATATTPATPTTPAPRTSPLPRGPGHGFGRGQSN